LVLTWEVESILQQALEPGVGRPSRGQPSHRARIGVDAKYPPGDQGSRPHNPRFEG